MTLKRHMFYWINPTSLANSYVLVMEKSICAKEGDKYHLLFSDVITSDLRLNFYPENFFLADPNALLRVKDDDITELTTRNQLSYQLLICTREWTDEQLEYVRNSISIMYCPQLTYEMYATQFKLKLLPCVDIHQYLPACHGFLIEVIGHLSSHIKYRDIHRVSALELRTNSSSNDQKDSPMTVFALRRDDTWVHVEIAAKDLASCKWQSTVPSDNQTAPYRRLMTFRNGSSLHAQYKNEAITVLSESTQEVATTTSSQTNNSTASKKRTRRT
jgi:hypothetical protein